MTADDSEADVPVTDGGVEPAGAIGRFREELDPIVFLFGAGLTVGIILLYRRYKATAPGLDPGVEADNTHPLIQLSTNFS